MSDSDRYVDPEEFDDPPITMECPECGLSGDVPGAWDGLRIECKDCGERFAIDSVGTDTDDPEVADK